MEEVKKLIGRARLDKALEVLLSKSPLAYEDDITQLKQRLTQLSSDDNRGILTRQEANLERNKITAATLALVNDINNLKNNALSDSSPKKEPTKNKIYFSYAWGDPKEKDKSREAIVNALYESLEEDGFNIIRDKMDLEYGGLISGFMNDIGEGDLIVVFVSEKYARSPYCMFELYEIARNSKWDKQVFSKRILPIPVEFIDFADPDVLDAYFEYWEKEESKWAKFIQKRIGQVSSAQSTRFHNTKNINQNFGNLSDWLTDMNQMTSDLLTENDFEKIKQTIVSRLKKE